MESWTLDGPSQRLPVSVLTGFLGSGKTTVLNYLIQQGCWLARMLTRKPRMVVAIALANKMARGIWAMLSKGEDYRSPATA